jgi:hypothetical protein
LQVPTDVVLKKPVDELIAISALPTSDDALIQRLDQGGSVGREEADCDVAELEADKFKAVMTILPRD